MMPSDPLLAAQIVRASAAVRFSDLRLGAAPSASVEACQRGEAAAQAGAHREALGHYVDALDLALTSSGLEGALAALVQLGEVLEARALLQIATRRAPVLAALGKSTLGSPVPLPEDPFAALPIDPAPLVGLALGTADRPREALLAQLRARLGAWARTEGLALRDPADGPTWVDLRWIGLDPPRPFVVPVASGETVPARLLEILEIRLHLWETWTSDPELLLGPLSDAMALVQGALRGVLLPLPPAFSGGPAALDEALYVSAVQALADALARWTEPLPAQLCEIAQGAVALVAEGARARVTVAERAAEEIRRALERAGVPVGDPLQGRRFAPTAGLAQADRATQAALRPSSDAEAPIRVRRTPEGLWLIAANPTIGAFVQSTLRGSLQAEWAF